MRYVPLAVILWWVVAALVMPPVQDEAYYFLWGRHLAFGYFDHPPGVALLAATHQWAAHVPGWLVPLVSRLGTLAAAVATLFVSRRLFRAAGLREGRALAAATLLSHGNLFGLTYGFVTTPDTALILCWIVALHEALRALQGQEHRWLTAGAATGLGLLAKYTMLLMGPVFLWALIRTPRPDGRSHLARPWPYLGGVVALALFWPNIHWNAENDWITFRFQLRHGFSLERPDLGGVPLPAAEPPLPGSPEAALAQSFLVLEEASQEEEKAPGPYDETLRSLNRYVGYYGSQIGLWGAFLVAIPLAWRATRRRRSQGGRAPDDPPLALAPEAAPLFAAATAVPLIVFGLISLGSKVEANWSAMYVFTAGAWLATRCAAAPRPLVQAWIAHVAILAVALLHVHTGFLPTKPHKDRLLRETHGYPALAARLAALDAPVFADTYQIAAMTRFWEPTLRVRQWPGITRVSEFLRNPALADLDLPAVEAAGGFWLVQNGLLAPRIPGFVPDHQVLLRDCVGEPLQDLDSSEALNVEGRCRRPVHEWYVIRYRRSR